MVPKIEWIDEWFGSPYYHVLYKNRDHNEAKLFLDNLIQHLNITKDDLILDLACGRGRHAIYLNRKGLNVVGIDISMENIEEARQHQNDRLSFYVHDMRFVFKRDTFNFILNFFTSFGYFDTKEENERVVHAAAVGLAKGGKLLIDFLNPYTVVHDLAPAEIKEIDGIAFHITKKIENGFIIKDIKFADQGRKYHFYEKVKTIRRMEFLEYFDNTGLEVMDIFGDYQLNPYIAEKSERMIFLLKK
jgi:SAM-dependent methyltransferase